MEKYRVRRGLFGKSVLQALKINTWYDVDYNKAPRALVSEIDHIEKTTNLEIELGICEGKTA